MRMQIQGETRSSRVHEYSNRESNGNTSQALLGRIEMESAWRGLLSLRDPPGAAHADGPPEFSPFTPEKRLHPRGRRFDSGQLRRTSAVTKGRTTNNANDWNDERVDPS